jgi:protein SCO1/2
VVVLQEKGIMTVHPGTRRRFLLMSLMSSVLSGTCSTFGRAWAEEAAADMHEHHHHGEAPEGIRRSEATYLVPALHLVRQDGSRADFPGELNDGRPVVLNFIYTSCTAICPLTSQVFSHVQNALAAEGAPVDLVSISIDPEYDTPPRLSEYARVFKATDRWHFYTGTQAASIALQRAFDVYRGDKMNHVPVTFLRVAPGRPWVRLEGFASPDDVLNEFRNLAHGGSGGMAS